MKLGRPLTRIFSRPGELDGLERALGYRFRDRTRLENALIHPSYRFEHPEVATDNQRLEFLGDAVLGILAASHLYRECDEVDEGRLTVMRSQVTSGKTLAAVAVSIGLDRHLRLGRGESLSGGRTRQSNLEDALEAVFGAAWEDGGLRAAETVFRTLFASHLEQAHGERTCGDGIWADNPKGHLQAVVQSRFKRAVSYSVRPVGGSLHAPVFEAEVCVDGLDDFPPATGTGPTKRAAETAAAAALLQRILDDES
ncbi:MAG: ribonuclease III [Kiritimatiellia bacterium]